MGVDCVHERDLFAPLGDDMRANRELEARIDISNSVPEEFRARWREGIVTAIKHHSGLLEVIAEIDERSAARLACHQEVRVIRASKSA